MKHSRSLPFLLCLVALCLCVAAVPEARAQNAVPAIIENGYRNVFGGPTPVVPQGGNPEIPTSTDALLPAYQAQRQNGTAFGGFPTISDTGAGYGTLQPNTAAPAAYSPGAVPYPISPVTAQVLVSVQLRSSIIGRPLAVFNISYNFGGEIPPPAKIDLATGQPIPGFYRAEPLNARIKTPVNPVTLIPTGDPIVNATSADPDGIQVVGPTTYMVGLNPQFYWSKHAQVVYATQPGNITIQWRESATTTPKPETYLIATSPDKPERTIFWTENGFNGPLVEVPAGRVNAVNIIYNSLVPGEVVAPYASWPSGVTDFTESDPAKKRYKTFYYETNLIHAYNVQGRVFVEYLGNPRGDGTSEPKGTEIVNIIKETTPGTRVVDLGEQAGPDALAGATVALTPKIIAGLGLSGQPYLHQQISAGGTKTTLYGIRETQPGVTTSAGQIQQVSNEVLIYWLETSPEGQLDLKWPKQYLGYVLEWPADPAKYSIYARPDSTGAAGLEAAIATAVQLDSSNNPALVHQDDPANSQAVLAPGNKFYTKVTPTDPTNRSLLRFTKDDDIWFERVWSQVDPYFLNPAPYLDPDSTDPAPYMERTVTSAMNPVGQAATGFRNISEVTVVDPATGDELEEGVDYTVDAATGVITLIEKRPVESIASLGTLNAGDTVEVRMYAGYSAFWQYRDNTGVPHWEARSFSLTSDGAATPLAAYDFRDGSGGFRVENAGPPGVPWTYFADLGTWKTRGHASNVLNSSTLISPSFPVTQTGPVTLRLKHRYNFAFYDEGNLPLEGGQIQSSVNGGAWQTVPDTAFSANPYQSTIYSQPPDTDPALDNQKAFGGKSAGYENPPPTITTVEITFSTPTLPFSSVPAVVDADIGSRIAPDTGAIAANTYGDTAPVYVGYIRQPSGTAFNVDAYKDPFVEGFDEAAKGAIIGVNALPGNDELEVWWYRESTPKGTKISGTYWPSFVQKYQLRWPTAPAEIELASNKGSDDLPGLQAAGEIYYQNDPTQPGYNPNEEHALMLDGKAWALRDDLNIATSSQPYVLLHYTEADQRPAMRVFKVERGSFDYPAVAGKVLQAPMPLPLLPPPLLADRALASYEMPGQPDPRVVSTAFVNTDAAFAHYQKFTWTDRKGILWVYRGPHDGNQAAPSPTLKLRYFYQTLPGFNFPGAAIQPAVGTITPYLRSGTPGAFRGDPVTGEVAGTPAGQRKEQPMDVVFRPRWPDAAPELRVGETLTLPKLGLPQVRGQQSAELIYQQSVAVDAAAGMAGRQKSARLFDPTRARVYPLSPSTLASIPASVNTSLYLGKTYFPNLPPHLSGRLYFDPAAGANGSLVFKGLFMNEPFGEKYLQLNVMSAADIAAAKGLTPNDPAGEKAKWDTAIDGLATTMETFVEDPNRRGTFIPLRNETATPRPPIVINGVRSTIPAGTQPLIATAPAGATPGATQRPPVAHNEVAEVFSGDTAVDSYAISASGGGKGYVVLATGSGMDTDFTPAGQPVSLQVFKVNAPLYRGELKVINSQNPLDEKLTLQHTGDFAGHPEEFDFEWRYAPPAKGKPLGVYSFVRNLIVPGSGETWNLISNPVVNSRDLDLDYTKYRTASASASDVVTSITLASGGSYRFLPEGVTVSSGNGTGATARLDGAINNVAITGGGSGYNQAPVVTFTGGHGTGATGTATVGAGGVITGVLITSGGSGYTSAPTVTFSPAAGQSGSGAAGVATLKVDTLTLINGGIGYSGSPTVVFNGGTLSDSGAAATATAVIGAPPVVSLPGTITINDGNGGPEHGVTLPNALLRRTFSFSGPQRPFRLFLSVNAGANDGAVVYLNGAPVASCSAPGHPDTPATVVPATAPAFDPLALVFEIDPNALVVSATPNNNVLTVELFTTADPGTTTTFNLRLEGSQEAETLTGWLPAGLEPGETASSDSMVNNAATPPTAGIVAVTGKNRHTIQGTSILTLTDNYLIMRYRAKAPANAAYVAGAGWSKWTEPQLAQGWIKRALAGINPFQQRVKDLFNHEANTSVSLVEQAGKRWEGDIALNLDNINDSGLIEIYETILRRGKMLSIEGTPGINYSGANDALLLAAGYLSDLYMILGNEAWADAANSTIAFNTDGQAAQYGDVASALFSFKGQLATVLDEELALLRGRDDFLLPGSRKTPVYNRLVWNYTRGIDSGEAIYALNYNIKDRVWDYSLNPNNPGNLPADGVISAADAAIAYPQGHGDAYGHYLTALTGYYSLLTNPNFSWTPRIEAVLVLGTPVSVDYQDERKFAAAAVALARTARQTLDLTYRQEFSASEDSGWAGLHDAKINAGTGQTRQWGTDDWACRGGIGALFHWATVNSLLPAVDPDPTHSGIQKIDRTTVPELAEIAAEAAAIQQSLDNADAHFNPLGLASGALTFDISPSEVDAGKTHFEQIYERAISALQNAVSAFNNAKGSTQFLRRQEDTLADQRYAIESQEQAFTNQLIELYGTPYTDDIGPGKTYKQDYAGPDLLHSMYVDLPEVFQDDGKKTPYTLLLDPAFADSERDAFDSSHFIAGKSVEFVLNARGQVVKPDAWTGRRVSPGRMQTAVSDLLLARMAAQVALSTYRDLETTMTAKIKLYISAVETFDRIAQFGNWNTAEVAFAGALKTAAGVARALAEEGEKAVSFASDAWVEGQPKVLGALIVDPSFPLRQTILTTAAFPKLAGLKTKLALDAVISASDDVIERLNFTYGQQVEKAVFENDNRQLLQELHSTLEDLKGGATAVDAAVRHLDQAQRDLYALQAEGDRIQQQRLVFRQHAAAIIQGYRTRDFAFRAFRDEALERYKALFDLSARYTYLAARAYDYETGLLDPDGNASAAGFYEKIVKARALGVVSDGRPQFAGASTGDPGLSGVLAEMAGDWSVARTRLGFNNPDRYRTTFSLRQENFRLIPGTEADGAWKDKLHARAMDNILDDPDVRRHAMQAGQANGLPVPGIVVEFSTTIANGYNFFGKPLAAGDHGFSPTSFATKIRSSGIAFKGYIGMDDPSAIGGAVGGIGGVTPPDPNLGFNDPNGLSATPYIYLIPAGADSMRSPPLGDVSTVRTWAVEDQAIPLPFNIANSDYSTQPAWVSAASLSEPAFMLRKHQAFRAVPDGTVFSSAPGFSNARLIGRSVWNSRWKIVIPGHTLLNDARQGVKIFMDTVKDIKVHFETYSYSGN